MVPQDAELSVTGAGIIAGFTQDRENASSSTTQRITVTGVAVCGNVHVRPPPPTDQEPVLPTVLSGHCCLSGTTIVGAFGTSSAATATAKPATTDVTLLEAPT